MTSPTRPVATRSKLCPKIILEGTRLTRKTDLAFALNDHPRITGPRRYRYHSPLISAEWCTFSPYPWGAGLINFEPGDEARALETYATWARLFELQPHYSWIVDRFHLSTIAWQREHGRTYDFGWLEERLLPLGFHLVLCTRREDKFEAARAERLTVSGNPGQYDDLSVFIREQDLLRELAAASRLPLLELDMTEGDLESACNRIADWMAASGGLWCA
ncbi:MAG: hypothetical protein HY263_10775 [Chloroflexi bacterium]|nr:hypothetical protein [Chloroflexota bacterium]